MKKPIQMKLVLELYKLERNGNGVDGTKAFQELERRLDPSFLKLYRRLRERKGNGIAVLKNGVCSECMIVYPQAHKILHCKSDIHFCEFCGRLLVVGEMRLNPKYEIAVCKLKRTIHPDG